MESGFDLKYSVEESSGEEKLGITSGKRFELFKVRLFGITRFVKKPSPSFSDDFQTLESLRKEYIIGTQLNHPSIVRYINFDGNSLFEEFIDGCSLRELIDKKDSRLFSEIFFRELTVQLFDALEYMHKSGVVHLDLKPENIMLTNLGNRIKIVDFGCAYSSSCDSTPGHTVSYLPPERKQGVLDISSDIYQAGKILDELQPFLGKSSKWRHFIDKATAENPQKRFETAGKALANIPQPLQFSKIIYPLVALITGITLGGLAVFEFLKRNPQQVVVENKMEYPTSTLDSLVNKKIQEKEIAIAKEKLTIVASPYENIDENIVKKITSSISSYYAKNVVPIYKQPEEFGFQKNSEEQRKASEEAKKKARVEAYKLQDKLIKKYPDKQDFIETVVANSLNEQQTRLGTIILSYSEHQ